MPACEQPLGRCAVKPQALRLKVGAFVPADAEPLQPFEDTVDQFRPVAFDVCILNSQEKRTAFVARKKPIK